MNSAEREFLQLADLLPDALFLVDTAGTLVSANSRGADCLGINRRNLSGRSLVEFTADAPEVVRDYLRACARTRERVPGALSLRGADGVFRPYRCEGAAYAPLAADKPRHVVLRVVSKSLATQQFLVLNEKLDQLGREVTRRRRAEEEARAQHEWFRVTLASIGDGVIATDAQGRVTFMNPVTEALTGWTLAEAEGRPLHDVFQIINEYSREPVENPVDQVLREGMTVGLANHTLLVARDGTERPIDDSAAPIRGDDGHLLGVVLIFRDVTERRHVQDALRRSEERLRLIVESATDFAIITFDEAGFVTSWNSGARNIFGYEAEEVLERDGVFIFTPEDRAAHAPERELTKARADGWARDERWHMRQDGSRFFASGVVTTLEDNGEFLGFLKILRDMTEAKQLQETLERQALELREADRRKDEFLATLAHELRNPLAPIRNAVEILNLKGTQEPVLQGAREVIDRQVQHMVRLVDDLLDVSRITRGKLDLRKERVKLSDVVEQALEAARPHIARAGHALTVSLPRDPVYLHADPVRLAQVVSNLLHNATKYTEPGGHIWLTAERAGQEVIVHVRDTGIGIPIEHQPRVFEMFSQVTTALERSQGGLGIGLALAKGLVEMHGGHIEVRSEGSGKGSEFTVRLPIIPDRFSEPLPDSDGNAGVWSAARRILVVDDNRDAADSLAMLLNLSGNAVETAYDGVEAVEKATAYQPDVILLDIGLPRLNGYDACRAIRQQFNGKRIIIFALTGWGQDEDRRRSAEAGFDGHLVKPVDLNALMKLLNEFVKTE